MSRHWVRRVLGFAPREFRSRYADELLATYEARERAAVEEGHLAAFEVRELVGAVVLVARLRLGLGPHGPGSGSPARRVPSALEAGLQDLRFALRTLARNPGFSMAAILVLALGVGATSAIFSAVNAYLFRPLPFADADRLVTVYETNPEFGWVDETAAPANLLDWREQVAAFSDVSGYFEGLEEVTASRDGEPVVLRGIDVMGNFFTTLGAAPAMGRTFRFEETWSGQSDVVVLSHDLWISHFGGDPGVVGTSLDLGDRSPEIVGVMPEGFRFPADEVQLWMPMGWAPDAIAEAFFRRAHFVRAFARLAPGVTLEEADSELQVVARRLQQEYPETNSVMGAGLEGMRAFLVKEARTPLLVLSGAVLLLLLLACTNVANLMLVRAGERSRELALRRALGAGRRRLVRQMLTESLVLVAAGGVLGLGLGWIGVRSIAALTRVGIDGATGLALDHRVVLVTLGAAVLSGVLFGAAPAMRAATGDAAEALQEGARGSTSGGGGLRTAGLLVSVEVALALLLVVGAGLMMRSYWHLGRVDGGFRTEGVLAVQFTVPSARYAQRDEVLSFYDRFAEALEARPGVGRVGTVQRLPLDGPSWSSQFQAEGWGPERVGIEILHRRADRGYFEALEIPVVAGRGFEPTDRLGPSVEGAPPPRLVVLVNETFAREHFPGEDPIGQRIAYTRSAGPGSTWYEIIGIVGDQHQESLARPPRAEVFENRDQDWGRDSWVVIRGEGDALGLLEAARSVLAELDPLVPLAQVRTLSDVRTESMAREGFVLWLLGAFGATALVLATVGVYAVTSRAARRRTQEIGIRMALGAGAADVLGMMLRQGLAVVGLGLAAGLLAALLMTRALASLLYGIEPTDPATLVAVVVLLGAVALFAVYLPARRATALDPLRSLKTE